jgi:hypothetical protein
MLVNKMIVNQTLGSITTNKINAVNSLDLRKIVFLLGNIHLLRFLDNLTIIDRLGLSVPVLRVFFNRN